ncbi:MAG: glycosyltransferase family 4 protein [Opitutaceae bacterium]|nr:glycosyltransferase family 4 protein [Opitutaceae bacterium]
MRLIFVNRVYAPSEAATAQLLTDLAPALAEHRWEVHVITSGAAGLPACESSTGVTIHRTAPPRFSIRPLRRILQYAAFLRGARRQLARLAAPDALIVLMTDPPMLAVAATFVGLRRGARVVQWIQDIYPEIVPATIGAWSAVPLAPLRWVRNRAWRAADRCVTLSDGMRAVVDAQLGFPRSCRVIPNWAPRELETAPPPAAVAAQRATWGLTDKFVVAYSGNLGRVHEFDTVLAAAARLQSCRDIVFLFAGGGARFPAVRDDARQRQLANTVFVETQPRSNLAVSLAAADVHLVTLRPGFERLVFPSKVAGVLAAARPLLFVGPEGSEIAPLVTQHDCGAVVANGDAAALAGQILHLRAGRSRWQQQGQNARAVYARRYVLAEAVTAWERLLHELMAGT